MPHVSEALVSHMPGPDELAVQLLLVPYLQLVLSNTPAALHVRSKSPLHCAGEFGVQLPVPQLAKPWPWPHMSPAAPQFATLGIVEHVTTTCPAHIVESSIFPAHAATWAGVAAVHAFRSAQVLAAWMQGTTDATTCTPEPSCESGSICRSVTSWQASPNPVVPVAPLQLEMRAHVWRSGPGGGPEWDDEQADATTEAQATRTPKGRMTFFMRA
jgi:hypothetical protein